MNSTLTGLSLSHVLGKSSFLQFSKVTYKSRLEFNKFNLKYFTTHFIKFERNGHVGIYNSKFSHFNSGAIKISTAPVEPEFKLVTKVSKKNEALTIENSIFYKFNADYDKEEIDENPVISFSSEKDAEKTCSISNTFFREVVCYTYGSVIRNLGPGLLKFDKCYFDKIIRLPVNVTKHPFGDMIVGYAICTGEKLEAKNFGISRVQLTLPEKIVANSYTFLTTWHNLDKPLPKCEINTFNISQSKFTACIFIGQNIADPNVIKYGQVSNTTALDGIITEMARILPLPNPLLIQNINFVSCDLMFPQNGKYCSCFSNKNIGKIDLSNINFIDCVDPIFIEVPKNESEIVNQVYSFKDCVSTTQRISYVHMVTTGIEILPEATAKEYPSFSNIPTFVNFSNVNLAGTENDFVTTATFTPSPLPTVLPTPNNDEYIPPDIIGPGVVTTICGFIFFIYFIFTLSMRCTENKRYKIFGRFDDEDLPSEQCAWFKQHCCKKSFTDEESYDIEDVSDTSGSYSGGMAHKAVISSPSNTRFSLGSQPKRPTGSSHGNEPSKRPSSGSRYSEEPPKRPSSGVRNNEIPSVRGPASIAVPSVRPSATASNSGANQHTSSIVSRARRIPVSTSSSSSDSDSSDSSSSY